MERGDACPRLLDLIPKERAWMVRDTGGGGENGEEEKKLELKLKLKLGPPGAEDWKKIEEEEPASVLSLGYFPKASNSSKRGFEGFKQQSLEMKACSPSSSHAAPSVNAAAANNNSSSQTRTVVGWPPVRSFRKNLASSSSKPPASPKNEVGSESGAKPEVCRKGLFVKINMDGVPIGRKVNLKAYDSYEKLSSAVEELFQGLLAAQKNPSPPPAAAGTQYSAKEKKKQAFTGLLDGSGEYTLVYEDSEGDRMLAGDVPWEMFVSTAKRLRVLKSSELELSKLSLGAISRKRAATEC